MIENRVQAALPLGLCEDEFRKVGKNFGPFDLAALPIGAYAPRWAMKSQHAHPCDTVRMHQLIGARATIGIHWGSVERLCLSPSHLLYGCSTYYMGTNEVRKWFEYGRWTTNNFFRIFKSKLMS